MISVPKRFVGTVHLYQGPSRSNPVAVYARRQGEEYLVGGDVITAIAGAPVRTHDDYATRLRALKPGQRVTVTVVRDGRARDLTLTVAERPRLPSDLAD